MHPLSEKLGLDHIIYSQQFNRDRLLAVFALAKEMERIVIQRSHLLSHKIMATLFYEPSTRTRLSFETAMIRLGGQVISTENASLFSSAAKGETLEDTIRVVGSYSDIIVLRHFENGASETAASVATIPIINAGDGSGQHPTQAILDIYTIQKELGRVDGLKIAMVGDLANGRTVRSLSYLLTKFDNIKLYFVSPSAVRMKEDILTYLQKHRVEYEELENLNDIAGDVDVIYQTRVQKERFADLTTYYAIKGNYIIDKTFLSLFNKEGIILHPLPRVDEISVDVDDDPRAAYFRQAENGLYVRMALLYMLLNK